MILIDHIKTTIEEAREGEDTYYNENVIVRYADEIAILSHAMRREREVLNRMTAIGAKIHDETLNRAFDVLEADVKSR